MPDIEKNEQPVYALIQQIKDGTLNPKTLSKEARCRCVEVLLNEAYSPLEMAQLFKTCERTIKRDIDDILEARKVSPDLEQAKKIIGEFWMYARIHRDKLMKLARSKDGNVSHSEKLQAEYMAFKVSSETIVRLQSLGYLPSKPVAIVGDIFHHSADSASQLEELNRQIAELGEMADGDDEVAKSVRVDVEAMKKLVDEIKTQTNEKTEETDYGKE
jgi:hypothetical protein